MKRGQIFWAELDKRRPVVLVSPTRRNELASDVLVVPCSTKSRPAPWHVELRRGEGGLPADSTAKCEQITNLRKSELSAAALGEPLSASRMKELERALLIALGVAAD